MHVVICNAILLSVCTLQHVVVFVVACTRVLVVKKNVAGCYENSASWFVCVVLMLGHVAELGLLEQLWLPKR